MKANPKILLALMPFWDPQIPPAGISCLKGFLQPYGYAVKTVDANIESSLKEIYQAYFEALKSYVPESRQGNFYKIGFDIMRNHLMAHLHRRSEGGNEYTNLVKLLVRSVFFVDIHRHQTDVLEDIVTDFFKRLGIYVLRLLEEERPDVLGISVYSDTLPASMFAFRLARENYPAIRTVMGGGVFASDLAPHTPNMASFLKQAPYIDSILVGEGEHLFLHYLEGRLPQSSRLVTLPDTDLEIVDLTAASLPDFSDFDLDYYPYLTAYTSRSCPFQCRFCAETMYWGNFRKKHASQVAAELKALYRQYGSQLFFMSDSLLNPVATELARSLAEAEISLYWDGYLRADGSVGELENALLLRKGGFYRARLGMESGSQQVLSLMNKRTTVAQMKAAIAGLAGAGIKTTTYWVVGYPGETEADFQETLSFLEEMADDIFEADCSPFWYYVEAQEGDRQWKHRRQPLYPDAGDMLVLQTWVLDCPPGREEIYQRMWRFVQRCRDLGIPNPYSLHEVYKADKRWQKLHRNAVPSLVEFERGKGYIDENRHISLLRPAKKEYGDDGDFGF